jgi:hypothetical protein
MPRMYRIQFRHAGDLLKSPSAQWLADFSERGSLRI